MKHETVDHKVKRSKHVVDVTLTNLFLRDLRDYGIDSKVFSKEGLRKINQTLEHLDFGNKKEEKEFKENIHKRVARYERFRDLDVDEKDQIAKVVREKGISAEEAYAQREKMA